MKSICELKSTNKMKKSYKKTSGFTIVELLVAIAIIGILSTIAFPSYQDSIRKSRRSDAHAGLSAMLLEQENYRMLNSAYASAFGTGSNDVKNPSSEYYSFSISGTSASAYTLKATAKTGSSQAKDTGCTEITINQSDTKLPAACW